MAIIDDLKFANIDRSYDNAAVAKTTIAQNFRPAVLVKMVKNYWRSRQHLKQLGGLSPEALRDIGLTQSDLHALGINAWKQDPGCYLEGAKQNQLRMWRMKAVNQMRSY